jgi:hypothetical protein
MSTCCICLTNKTTKDVNYACMHKFCSMCPLQMSKCPICQASPKTFFTCVGMFTPFYLIFLIFSISASIGGALYLGMDMDLIEKYNTADETVKKLEITIHEKTKIIDEISQKKKEDDKIITYLKNVVKNSLNDNTVLSKVYGNEKINNYEAEYKKFECPDGQYLPKIICDQLYKKINNYEADYKKFECPDGQYLSKIIFKTSGRGGHIENMNWICKSTSLVNYLTINHGNYLDSIKYGSNGKIENGCESCSNGGSEESFTCPKNMFISGYIYDMEDVTYQISYNDRKLLAIRFICKKGTLTTYFLNLLAPLFMQ